MIHSIPYGLLDQRYLVFTVRPEEDHPCVISIVELPESRATCPTHVAFFLKKGSVTFFYKGACRHLEKYRVDIARVENRDMENRDRPTFPAAILGPCTSEGCARAASQGRGRMRQGVLPNRKHGLSLFPSVFQGTGKAQYAPG